MRKHGIGKGLMTVWRATNPDAGDVPIGFGDGEVSLITKEILQKPEHGNKKPRKTLKTTVSYPINNVMLSLFLFLLTLSFDAQLIITINRY